MIWNVRISRRADRDLANLDPSVYIRVVEAIDRLAEKNQGDLIKLRGMTNTWRLRVGDWRVRLRFYNEEGFFEVLRVQHRREAYRQV
jgi:mRNA interferase RelE/StbE